MEGRKTEEHFREMNIYSELDLFGAHTSKSLRTRILFNNSGTVLVLVLWVLAMLTVIGGYYAVEARIRRNLGQAAWNEIQGREAVYSILRLAALKIAPPGASRTQDAENAVLEGEVRLYPDGTSYSVEFGGNTLEFVIQDESGKLSINKATEQQLEALFSALLPEDDQRVLTITESILDWRDVDNIARTDGAEDGFYSDRTPPYRAANRPFLLLDELLLVRGVDMNLFYGPLKWTSEEVMEEDTGENTEEIQSNWTGSLIDLLSVYNNFAAIDNEYAAPPLQEIFRGKAGRAGAGKTLCLQMKWQGTRYVIYWGRLGAGRFGIMHWSEQGEVAPEIKGHDEEE